MLEIGHADGEWVALCNGFRGVGSSADEALRLALDDETSPIGAAAASRATFCPAAGAAWQINETARIRPNRLGLLTPTHRSIRR